MLTEQDITLHLAANIKVGFKGLAKSRMNSKIFGFTKDNVLTASGMDSSLRPQIQVCLHFLFTFLLSLFTFFVYFY